MSDSNALEDLFKQSGISVFDRAKVGIFLANGKRESLYANNSFRELYKRINNNNSGNGSYWEAIHPDCDEESAENHINCVRTIDNSDKEHHIVYTVSRLDRDIFMTVVQEITRILVELKELHDEVKELREIVEATLGKGEFITICSVCNKIRQSDGSWIELNDTDKPAFKRGMTHGYCPCCARDFMEEMQALRNDRNARAAEDEKPYPEEE